MNVELLNRVCEQILKTPEQFHMEMWFSARAGDVPKHPLRDCGTTACIGGWIVALGYPEGKPITNDEQNSGGYKVPKAPRDSETVVSVLASKLLKLGEGAAGHRLFYVSYWPKQFAASYKKTRNSKRRAEITVARIKHFIETDGAE